MKEISIVIPVYKAKDCLNELYTRLTETLMSITNSYEIILIEDCGNDGSWEVISQIAQKDNKIKAIQFSRNFGQHYGISAGLDHASGNWVVVMDCDLQDRPEEIPRLYMKAQEGFDVVIAQRDNRQDKRLKKLTSKIFYKVFGYLAGIQYDSETGNFRIISKKVVQAFLQMKEQLRFFGGMVAWLGFSTAYIRVEHNQRFAGETSYSFRKLMKLAIDTILAYSEKPLKLMIKLGFIISFISFAYGIYTVTRALVDHVPVLGWSSIIASIYFIGGIIIANMGLLAIYLGKTFEETKKRPLYIIREMIN